MSLMGDDPDERHEVNGTVIRFLWYDGARHTPLWDAGTVLAKDANWLRGVLGLSDTLVGELTAWAEARDALEDSGLADAQAVSALHAHADDLVTRLRAELHPRFTVEHLR